jgi:WD40 repeat protein
LTSGDQKGNIGIWDVSALPPLTGTLQFDGFVENAVITPSGNSLIASSDGQVWLLEYGQLPTSNRILTAGPILKLPAHIEKLVISPDSKWIGLSTEEGEVYLYNIPARSTKLIAREGFQKNIAFSSDGKLLTTVDVDSKVRTWDTSSLTEGPTLFDGSAKVLALAVYSNQLALGLTDKILVIDINTGKIISEIQSPGNHAILAFSPDGALLASGDSSGQLSIWQASGVTFSLLHSLPSEEFVSMSFDPQGKRLFAGTMTDLLVYDPFAGNEINRIRHRGAVYGISFSPDGNTLATASMKAVQFWDVQKISDIITNELVSTACSHLTQNFTSAEWSAFFGEETYRKQCDNLPVP